MKKKKAKLKKNQHEKNQCYRIFHQARFSWKKKSSNLGMSKLNNIKMIPFSELLVIFLTEN